MSDMVTLVARAIFQEQEMVHIAFGAMPDWDHLSERDRDNCRAVARVAIEAFIAGMDREFEAAAWQAVRPYHDLSERAIRSSVPTDFFQLALSRAVKRRSQRRG